LFEIGHLPARLLERLSRGRNRPGPHDRRIDARGRPGGDPRQRGEAAPLRLGSSHQHDGGSAVIDPGGVAGRHRAVLREGRFELRHALEGRTRTDILVLIDDDVAFSARDRDRHDLVLEPAGLLSRLGLVLRRDGESVLLLAGELPALRDVLRGVAHVVAIEGVHQAVLQHGVDELEIAHLRAAAHMLGMRGERHRFLAAGDDDRRVSVGDLLHPDRHGAQPRPAQLVQAPGRLLLRDPCHHRGYAGWVLSLGRRQDLAEDDFVDLTGLDLCALQRRLDGHRAKLVSRRVGECAVERADGCPRRADDYDVFGGHSVLLSCRDDAYPDRMKASEDRKSSRNSRMGRSHFARSRRGTVCGWA
jgi:hypothetical protein